MVTDSGPPQAHSFSARTHLTQTCIQALDGRTRYTQLPGHQMRAFLLGDPIRNDPLPFDSASLIKYDILLTFSFPIFFRFLSEAVRSGCETIRSGMVVIRTARGGGRFEEVGSYVRARRVGPFVFVANTTYASQYVVFLYTKQNLGLSGNNEIYTGVMYMIHINLQISLSFVHEYF